MFSQQQHDQEQSNEAHPYMVWDLKDGNFEKVVVQLNFSTFFHNANSQVRQLLEFICDHPCDLTSAMALALDSLRLLYLQANGEQNPNDQRHIVVRLINYNFIYPLSQIKSHLINKFVCLRGTVLRVSSIKVLVESITF